MWYVVGVVSAIIGDGGLQPPQISWDGEDSRIDLPCYQHDLMLGHVRLGSAEDHQASFTLGNGVSLNVRLVVHRVDGRLDTAEPSKDVLLHQPVFTLFVPHGHRMVGTRSVEQLLEVVGGRTTLGSAALLLGVASLTPYRPPPGPAHGGRRGFCSATATNVTFLLFFFFLESRRSDGSSSLSGSSSLLALALYFSGGNRALIASFPAASSVTMSRSSFVVRGFYFPSLRTRDW